MGLRVEETAPKPSVVVPIQQAHSDLEVKKLAKERDDWRAQAIQTAERLQYAETQLKDLRQAADDNRARMNKAKTRQDTAQAKVNDLQVENVRLKVDNETLREQVAVLKAGHDTARRKVWEALGELGGSAD